MEVTFAWFWVIKSILAIVTLYITYKAIWVHKVQNTLWTALLALCAVLLMFNPIKINGTNSVEALRQQTYTIMGRKVLPEKVRDTSFETCN